MKNLRSLSTGNLRVLLIIVALIGLYFASVAANSSYCGLGASFRVKAAVMAALSGDWTADLSTKHPGKVQLSFQRRTDDGKYNNTMGETFEMSELSGLPADISTASRLDVKFNIIREAGTLVCEGSFRDGRGLGTWTFAPDAGFAAAMKSRGFGSLDEEDMLRAAFHNLTTKYADEIKAAGYDRLTFDELNRAATHDITTAYIKSLREAGYDHLTMEELIRASNHDIDAGYIKEVRAMGYDKQPLETVIRLRNHDITPNFMARMKSAGFGELGLEDLIRLQNHDVTPEFVAEIRGEGYNEITADQAIRLKNHDVDRDFIRRAKAQGYANQSLDDLIRLKNKDVVK